VLGAAPPDHVHVLALVAREASLEVLVFEDADMGEPGTAHPQPWLGVALAMWSQHSQRLRERPAEVDRTYFEVDFAHQLRWTAAQLLGRRLGEARGERTQMFFGQ